MFQLEIFRLAPLATRAERERIDPARQDGYRCDMKKYAALCKRHFLNKHGAYSVILITRELRTL